MKKPLKLLVIGGVAAGTKGAAKAHRDDPTMEITIITDEPYISYAGCGLAYYICGIVDSRDKLFARSPAAFKEKQNITVLTRHRAERINTYDRSVKVTDLSTGTTLDMPYDRLLIATGASSIIPPIDGVDRKGVFPLRTVTDTDAIKDFLENRSVQKACIIGGGYIGAEMVEVFSILGIGTTLFEKSGQLMPQLFDPDIADIVRKHMEEKGTVIVTQAHVERILGDESGTVRGVVAEGKEYPCDIVVLGTGVRPNVKIAHGARITIGPTGAIKVDKFMETSAKNIFAAGDCTESQHLVSGKSCWFPLGSTANKQGRVAGAAIAGGKKTFPGVLGTAIVKVFDLALGRTGLSESESKEAGFNPLSATVITPVRPGYYPGGGEVTLKLTIDRGTQKLLGAQVYGNATVDKVVDTVAAALTGKMTLSDLVNLDVCYSPPYAPALGAVIIAAGVLEEKL